jgi:hypothetical protein
MDRWGQQPESCRRFATVNKMKLDVLGVVNFEYKLQHFSALHIALDPGVIPYAERRLKNKESQRNQ